MCDELSEKIVEIYLEMKSQWLQQFYVNAKSRKSAGRKGAAESEKEEGWNEALKVDSKFQKLEVIAKSRELEERRITDEPERENEEVVKPEAETLFSRNWSKQFFSLAKEECNLNAGKVELKPEGKLEEFDIGGADKESLTEKQPPEPPDGGGFKGGSRSLDVAKREGGDNHAMAPKEEMTSEESPAPAT